MVHKKNILITAGPVWVPLDKVRILTTLFSGNLGIQIAKQAIKNKYNVILLYGPGRAKLPNPCKNLKVIKYKYFNELLTLVDDILIKKNIDIVIHSAAVADYMPIHVSKTKIKSGAKLLNIKFKPTIKIVNRIKKIDNNIFLVKFKLEVNKTKKDLLKISQSSLKESNADLIVANDFNTLKKGHKAYIINADGKYLQVEGKAMIAEKLFTTIQSNLSP